MLEMIKRVLGGDRNDRVIRDIRPITDQVNAFEPEFTKLSDEELANTAARLRQILQEGKTLDDVLPEAFAAVRESAKRTIGLRHYDVQIIGGVILHQGKIAEMKTGEGKTLVATLAAFLNALEGKGVHIVTVNDYLAKRDFEWMGPVYEKLGLTVGFIQHDMPLRKHKEMYEKDITFVTNNELGFDFLRDNLVRASEERVLRGFHYCIIDEVDSILIDEARTPLIISGQGDPATKRYYTCNRVAPLLKGRLITENEEVKAKYEGVDLSAGYDYLVDEKNHTVVLTEQGIHSCERILKIPSLYDDLEGEWVHHITTALKAHNLFKKDVHYVVKNGEIIIVDEFTGRLMPGRRWSDGLHQAVEAKENLRIEAENQTLATITFQNFFRQYKKLSGMTGTALTEANEFWQIYKLDVAAVPTNKPNIRMDYPDRIFRTVREKNAAIVAEVEQLWKKGQPILLGTRSIEGSEALARALREKGIPHNVLNAKYHEQEAQIIAQAGRKGSVTIATNMAGRGTDILLGGNPPDAKLAKEVQDAGGLHVLGSERHESRRIDNQLRGRCGRQGDPGSSRFYLSLEDELMRLFGSERISGLMAKLGMEEGEDIQHPWINKAVQNAQKKVEGMNFDIRKQVLDYDNVMNKQREAIYRFRNAILDSDDISDRFKGMVDESADDHFAEYLPKSQDTNKWDLTGFQTWIGNAFGANFELPEDDLDRENLIDRAKEIIENALQRREEKIGKENFNRLKKGILLALLDSIWVEHLTYLEQLRRGIFLRAYAQKDPLIEFQKEGFRLFDAMMTRVRDTAIDYIFRMSVESAQENAQEGPAPTGPQMRAEKEEFKGVANMVQSQAPANAQPQAPTGVLPVASAPGKKAEPVQVEKVGRNDPCPCGSGKKYKKCHGN